MAKDKRDVLEVLKGELKFIQSGGYRKTPYFPPLMFEDSPTCLNHDRPHFPRPCSECVMMQLVPPGYHGAEVPCRHIPLNAMGETVDTLYDSATEREIEIAVTKWLKGMIHKLEMENAATTAAKGKTGAGSERPSV
jgi:hypothetical protein